VQQLWSERQAALAEVRQWDMYARAALKLKGEAYNIGIRWQREQDGRFMMLLEAPFGQGVFRIDASAAGAYRLSMPDGRTFKNSSAEALLDDVIGWSLPISGLDYWIRGLPKPTAQANQLPLLDSKGYAQSIRQNGWDIEYLEYFSSVDTPALPRRLRLANETVTLKLAIERWQPSTIEADNADLFPSFD